MTIRVREKGQVWKDGLFGGSPQEKPGWDESRWESARPIGRRTPPGPLDPEGLAELRADLGHEHWPDMPLADYECPHGALPGDRWRPVGCKCWSDRRRTTLLRVNRAQAAALFKLAMAGPVDGVLNVEQITVAAGGLETADLGAIVINGKIVVEPDGKTKKAADGTAA